MQQDKDPNHTRKQKKKILKKKKIHTNVSLNQFTCSGITERGLCNQKQLQKTFCGSLADLLHYTPILIGYCSQVTSQVQDIKGHQDNTSPVSLSS